MLKLEEKVYAGEINEGMVNYVRRLIRAKYCVRPIFGVECEDLEQNALLELTKHIEKFNPRKSPLAGFLSVIANSAMTHGHRYSTAKMRWNGEQPIPYEQLELTALDHSAFMDRSIMTLCFKLDLFYFSGLNSLEHDIVDLLYQGLTRLEISSELKLPPQDLDNMIAQIGGKYLAGATAE